MTNKMSKAYCVGPSSPWPHRQETVEPKYNLYELLQENESAVAEALQPNFGSAATSMAKTVIWAIFDEAKNEIADRKRPPMGWGANIPYGLIGTKLIYDLFFATATPTVTPNVNMAVNITMAMAMCYSIAKLNITALKNDASRNLLKMPQTDPEKYYAVNSEATGDKAVFNRAQTKINALIAKQARNKNNNTCG